MEHRLPLKNENQLEMANTDETSAQVNLKLQFQSLSESNSLFHTTNKPESGYALQYS